MNIGFLKAFLLVSFLVSILFLAPSKEDGYSMGYKGIPTRAVPQFSFNATEDEPFNGYLQDVNITGENLTWAFVDKPDWLDMNSGLLFGTPGNDDVGYANFTVNVTSTTDQVFVDVSIKVMNTPPLIVAGSAAPMAWEDQYYESKFNLREDGEKWEVRMRQSGPWNTTWLEIDRTGKVFGTPRNIDVGNWTVNLTLDDMNGGLAYFEWNITVVNEVPNITVKDYGIVQEWVQKTIDFDCRSEGDGATYYQVVRDDFGGSLDPVTGKFTFMPGLSGKTGGYLIVEALDFFGGSDKETLEISINNTPPELTMELPTFFKAGEEVLVDLDSNDEPGYIQYNFNGHYPTFSDLWNSDERWRNQGKLRILPWNMDAGDHSYSLYLTDRFGETRYYYWNFTVIPNSSFKDPEVNMTLLSISENLVRMDVDVDPNGQKYDLDDPYYAYVNIEYPGIPQTVAFAKFDPDSETFVEIPISNISGLVNLTVNLYFEHLNGSSRHIEKTIQVEVPEASDIGNGGSWSVPWWIFVLVVILLALFIAILIILSFEKTSYAVQMALFRGGTIDEEPIVALVHEHPGVHFKELMEYSNFSRRDLVSTLVHLENSGSVRPIPDGALVRFYPTVGSFVDGPLVLNKQQERIASSLLDVVKLSLQELSDRTGISKKKLERETSLLSLKGIMRKKNGREGPEYYMSAREKKRMREWLEKRI